MKISRRLRPIVWIMASIGAITGVNFISSRLDWQWDLTEDRRYTLTRATREILHGLDREIYIDVLLDEQDPPGIKRLRDATEELLREFQRQSPYITYGFTDPNEGTAEEVNIARRSLAQKGIRPTTLTVRSSTGTETRLIYPWVIVRQGMNEVPVSILENVWGYNQEENINLSINLLEYKIMRGIRRILQTNKKKLVFLQGHGELDKAKLSSLRYLLHDFYAMGFLNLDSTGFIPSEIDIVVIAGGTRPFSEKHKFAIDQYLMQGGKVIWLIEGVGVSLDSLRGRDEFMALARDLNIHDQLFRYGIRLTDKLVLDLECTRIPQVVGVLDGKPQIEMFPWFYHILAIPSEQHVTVRNLDRVNLFFPTVLDTVRTKVPVRKTVLLHSSPHSRYVNCPARVGFDILQIPIDPGRFDKGPLPVAILLEGRLPSLYEGRVSPKMEEALQAYGYRFRPIGEKEGALAVITDVDFIKSVKNTRTQKYFPVGYNPWEKQVFRGGRDFILNLIEYMTDKEGILQARAKDIRLRMLDTVRAQSQRLYWQAINLLVPIAAFFMIGMSLWLLRRYYFAGVKKA